MFTLSIYILTHLPLNKMAAILQTNIFKCIFLNENVRIQIQISLKSVSQGPNDSKSALVQVMTWHQTGDKPLSEPMTAQFTDAYIYIYTYTYICVTRGELILIQNLYICLLSLAPYLYILANQVILLSHFQIFIIGLITITAD